MTKDYWGSYGRHVVQCVPEESFCAGCSACEAVCALTHDGRVGQGCRRIFLKRGTVSMEHTILTCQHCYDHPCYHKCPRKDSAMCVDENNIVYINEENCIGCGLCIKACVFDPPRINMEKNTDRKKWRAKKCDLCRTRPEGAACIRYCQVRCLSFSDGSGDNDFNPPLIREGKKNG